MRFPYMFPVGLSILAGALASTVAYSDAYMSVGGGLVSLIQDAFLLAWCIRIANVGRDPALLRSISRAWAISATCLGRTHDHRSVRAHPRLLSGETCGMASGPRSRSATRTWRPTTSSAHFWCCGPRGFRGRRALRWPAAR